MPITFRCPACNMVYTCPDELAGAKVQCSNPRCGQRLILPPLAAFPPPAGAPAAGPTRVQVSARVVQWPLKCACCLGEADAVLPVFVRHLARGAAGRERFWEVPYCSACMLHVEAGRLGMQSPLTDDCCTSGPAMLHDGLLGTVHTLRFLNPGYARRFVAANRDKCLRLPMAPR